MTHQSLVDEASNDWVSVCVKCNKEWKQNYEDWWASWDPLCINCKRNSEE